MRRVLEPGPSEGSVRGISRADCQSLDRSALPERTGGITKLRGVGRNIHSRRNRVHTGFLLKTEWSKITTLQIKTVPPESLRAYPRFGYGSNVFRVIFDKTGHFTLCEVMRGVLSWNQSMNTDSDMTTVAL